MVKRTFFAELHRLVQLKISASEDPHLCECKEVFLALVKTCKADISKTIGPLKHFKVLQVRKGHGLFEGL